MRRVVTTEGGNCYGESQSRSESNGQKDCEASRHRPSMSGVAQAIHIKLSENVLYDCRLEVEENKKYNTPNFDLQQNDYEIEMCG